MRLPLLVAVLVASTAACAAVPDAAGADHRHRRCFPKGSDTIALGARARVYETAEDENQNYAVVACALRTGRRVLGEGADIDYLYEVSIVRFAKWRVAATWRSSSRYFSSAGLDVVDLRSGEKHTITSMAWEGSVTDVELKPNGSVAWIQSREGTATVTKLDASGRHELDAGPAIGLDSLALSGSRLYWMNDDQPRTALLD